MVARVFCCIVIFVDLRRSLGR